MNSVSTINVPFHGNNLCIVNHEGKPYVPMKPIVEGMGLSWEPQLRKLNQRFSKGMIKMVIPTIGGAQETVCLAMHKLTGWLFSIMPNKVKPEIRDKVIQYQEECDDVLYEYWTTGEVKAKPRKQVKQIAGRITSEQQEAIKQLVLNRGKALPKEKQAKAMITMWSSLKSHFGCTYKEIDSDKFTEALSLAARVPLEGEYLPKQTERFVGCRVLHHYDDKGEIVKSEIAADDEELTSPKVFADLAESRGYVMVKKDSVGAKFNKHKIAHTLEGAVIHIRTMKEYWNNGLKDSLKQLGYQHTGSMTEHMTDILFHLDWAIHEIKGDNLEKISA
ncbi:phage antirepressor N-terminal domain-containing protein [Providencia rettgeri]|nr:phage antirepressor N-terminal domain-containing protein [Providencia rettgeri]